MTDRGSISPNPAPSLRDASPAVPMAAGISLSLLTPREREVVALRCNYYQRKEIAAKLGIHEKTVSTHINKSAQKFGAISLGELYRRARLMGICADGIHQEHGGIRPQNVREVRP